MTHYVHKCIIHDPNPTQSMWIELGIYQPSKVLGALVCNDDCMRNDGVWVALGQPDGFVSPQ